ncbi:MAG: TonB-dependent receptor, partial [Acidobacteria bacterium]|nr:TonB-dependent receptor [Acidobacteriota bacterium]
MSKDMINLKQAGVVPLLLVMAAVAASGQILTGTITGEITDPSGARIPGVSINAVSVATGIPYKTQSNEAGIYVLTMLPTGAYRMDFQASGFRLVTRTGLRLGAEQVLRIDVALEVGAVSDAITVSSEAPLIQTEHGTVGSRFDYSRIENLPVGRSATAVLRTVPGVIPNPSGYGDSVSDGNINGGRAASSSLMVDGLSTENSNLNVSGYAPILEAVDEVTIQTSNYSAETGRGAASVQLTTKPGTNDVHGVLFHYFQNDKLNANAYFNNATGNARPAQRYNLFGGLLSGPVWLPHLYDGHNKTFFMFAYEGIRQIGYANKISTLPTAALREGNFAGLAAIYDRGTAANVPGAGLVVQPFAGNIIPTSRIAPQSKAMLAYYPVPNLPGTLSNYSYLQSLPSRKDSINVRGDHNLSDRSRLTARYGRIYNTSLAAVSFPGPAGAGSNSVNSNNAGWTHRLTASHTYLFTPATINDFRFGYFQVHTLGDGPGTYEDWAAKLGFSNVTPDKFPLVNIATFPSFGGSNIQNLYPARNFDIADTVSLVRGRHLLKLGGQYRTLVFYDGRGTGVSFNFDTQATYNPATPAARAATGNAFASYLLGIPSSTTTENRQNGHFKLRSKYGSLFLQDDWKVTSRLTLNLGLRWETTTPRTEDNDLQTVFNLDTLHVDIAGQNGYPRTLRDANWADFAPRIGFAWSAAKDTVIRGGYGIFYLQVDVTGNTFLTPGPAQATQTYVANGAANDFPVTFADTAATAKVPELSSNVAVTPSTSLSWMPRHYPNAYEQQWNINVQHQWRTFLFETGYVGNHGSHLEFSRNLNTIPIELLTAPGFPTLQSRRPFPTAGAINTQRSDPMGDSNYHSLQTRVQNRFSHGLSFSAAYTFSKVIDNASDVLSFRQVGIVAPQNGYDLRAERSVATFNRSHA